MHFYINTIEKSRTARSDKNTITAALKRSMKQLLGTCSTAQVKHYRQTRKLEKKIKHSVPSSVIEIQLGDLGSEFGSF